MRFLAARMRPSGAPLAIPSGIGAPAQRTHFLSADASPGSGRRRPASVQTPPVARAPALVASIQRAAPWKVARKLVMSSCSGWG